MPTVREFRLNLAAHLDRVKSGESVEVTRNGVVIAVMVPPGAVKADTKLAGVARELARKVRKIEGGG